MSVLWMALVIAAFTVISRVLTVFTPLYFMHQGLRASLLPAINLSQISEFSLVVLGVGITAQHISTETSSAASFAFVLLAVLSTFVMTQSDGIVRSLIGFLKRIGLRDLDHKDEPGHGEDGGGHGGHGEPSRILLLGFFRTASALVAEIEKQNKPLLDQIGVIDFNPNVYRNLTDRGVKVTYGDISNTDTLMHAGLEHAEIVISSVPDWILKGTTNAKLVRQVRALNPKAKIFAVADLLSGVQDLYDAGADYVTVTRLGEAHELVAAINAADKGLLDDQRSEIDAQLRERNEVLP